MAVSCTFEAQKIPEGAIIPTSILSAKLHDDINARKEQHKQQLIESLPRESRTCAATPTAAWRSSKSSTPISYSARRSLRAGCRTWLAMRLQAPRLENPAHRNSRCRFQEHNWAEAIRLGARSSSAAGLSEQHRWPRRSPRERCRISKPLRAPAGLEPVTAARTARLALAALTRGLFSDTEPHHRLRVGRGG